MDSVVPWAKDKVKSSNIVKQGATGEQTKVMFKIHCLKYSKYNTDSAAYVESFGIHSGSRLCTSIWCHRCKRTARLGEANIAMFES